MKTKAKNYILPAAAVICVVSIVVMIAALAAGGKTGQVEFTPPPFETNAQTGTPEVPENLGYSQIYQDGMGFSAWVCGNVTLNRNSADVYFTNPETNTVWLKLRIYDEAGSILGETGLLRPGEYVQSVKFDPVPENGAGIRLKIMAYEPETYYSAGAVSLNTAVSKGGA